MGPFAVGLFIPLGFFIMLFGIIYIGVTARNRERMAMIEKGADPALFEAKKKVNNGGVMKAGLFLLGVGLGIVVAYFLAEYAGMRDGAAYPSMIFVFGGAALIVSHYLQLNQDKKDKLPE